MNEFFIILCYGILGFMTEGLGFLSRRSKDVLLCAISLLCLFAFFLDPISPLILAIWPLLTYACLQIDLKQKSRFASFIPALFSGVILLLFLLQKFRFVTISESISNTNLTTPVMIGFSFLMFQSIATFIDARNGSFVLPDLATFYKNSLLVPCLFAGPYARMTDLQAEKWARPQFHQMVMHFFLICLGLFKFALGGRLLGKDWLSGFPFGAGILEYANPLSVILLCSTALYLNFSGFSDIVVGCGRLLGFNVPANFQFPFLAQSAQDYWRNWHITLGAWFRDYVFLPLQMSLSRKAKGPWQKKSAQKLAIFTAFLLIGLWHGVTEKFVLWSVVNALLVTFSFRATKLIAINVLITFLLMSLVNALFLAPSIEIFLKLLDNLFSARILSFRDKDASDLFLVIFLLGLSSIGESIYNRFSVKEKFRPAGLICFWFATLALIYLAIEIGLGRAESIYVGI